MMKLKFLFIGLAALTVACGEPTTLTPPSANPTSPTTEQSPNPTSPTTEPSTDSADQQTYATDRFGFQFSYPEEFAIDKTDENLSPQGEDTLQASLSIWPQEVYENIKAGAYEGGTEYPPDINVSVHSNPNGLSLIDWAEEHQPGVQSVEQVEVDGQEGIAYQADGLYPSDNVAVYSPDGQIILLSVGYINQEDEPLREAFQDVVASFQFVQ